MESLGNGGRFDDDGHSTTISTIIETREETGAWLVQNFLHRFCQHFSKKKLSLHLTVFVFLKFPLSVPKRLGFVAFQIGGRVT